MSLLCRRTHLMARASNPSLFLNSAVRRIGYYRAVHILVLAKLAPSTLDNIGIIVPLLSELKSPSTILPEVTLIATLKNRLIAISRRCARQGATALRSGSRGFSVRFYPSLSYTHSLLRSHSSSSFLHTDFPSPSHSHTATE
jgi:hypothetical protein